MQGTIAEMRAAIAALETKLHATKQRITPRAELLAAELEQHREWRCASKQRFIRRPSQPPVVK